MSPDSPTALVSYAHDDGKGNAQHLAAELRLRGFATAVDTEAFRPGYGLDGEMAEAVDADLVVGHLGPAALVSEAVVQKELGPALRSARRFARPVVLIVPHGIGGSRPEVDTTIAGRLRFSPSTIWADTIVEGKSELDPTICAGFAEQGLRGVFGTSRGPSGGQWDVVLATRGSRPHHDGLVVDATELIGGPERRPGTPQDWTRLAVALRDVERVLARHGRRRSMTVTPQCHETAALLFGLTFSTASRWALTVQTRDGAACSDSAESGLDGLREVPAEMSFEDRRLFVGVDLVGRGVEQSIDRLVHRDGRHPGLHVHFESTELDVDLTAERQARMAAGIARRIKAHVDRFQPERVELFYAGPAAAAVLLGRRLDTLDVPIGLWEHHGDYTLSVDFPIAK